MDIDEFNIQLKDTLLIFQKTGPRSIAVNWNTLLSNLIAHYRDYSQGGNRIPEEIYFSVLSEGKMAQPTGTNGLASYWALYFEDDSRSWIYDLEHRRLSPEDMYILSDQSFWDSRPD